MTESEVSELLPEVARSCRGYVAWREKEIAAQANANNTTLAEEATELYHQWRRVLERTELDAARMVLRKIESGEMEVAGYDYGKLPGIIRREARGFSMPRINVPQTRRHEEPSYRCLACLDTGIVEVLNPRWVQAHEEQIAEGLPDGWYSEARQWCRVNDAGHLKTTVVCFCEHPVAHTQRERVARFRRNELPSNESPARREVFNARTMPPLMSSSPQLIAKQLQEWIKTYEPFAGVDWEPDPAGYDAYA